MFSFMYKYPGTASECIDTADTKREAEMLYREYTLAYQGCGKVWVVKGDRRE